MRKKRSIGVESDADFLLRVARRQKMVKVKSIQFKETNNLGHIFEVLDGDGNVCGTAWFDSNARPHIKIERESDADTL